MSGQGQTRERCADIISPTAAHILLALKRTPQGAKGIDFKALVPKAHGTVKIALGQLLEMGAITYTGTGHRRYFLSVEGLALLDLAEKLAADDAKRPARRAPTARDVLSKEDLPDPLKAKWLYTAW